MSQPKAAQEERDAVWTVERVLAWTKDEFARRNLDNPRLDAEVLLAHVLACDRIRLYTHFDQPLSADERSRYRALVKRRAQHEPVAYLIGRREFFGHDFEVNAAVLIPRPETEHVVETALAFAAAQSLTAPRILDVGTGSGAIAVTLALQLPAASVVATDLSTAALEVAAANLARHGCAARVELRHGDLFEPVRGERFDIIVANPPYVEETAKPDLMPDVRDHEPAVALFAGPQGFAVLDRLCDQVTAHLATPGLLACEAGAGQFGQVAARLRAQGPWSRLEAVMDLGGHQRVVRAER